MGIVAEFLETIDGAVKDVIQINVQNIAQATNGPIIQILGLYFILYGIGIWRGTIQSDVSVFVVNVI